MPPDNTAHILQKGYTREPAPVTFPHRMRAQNRPARTSSFLRDARLYAVRKLAAQRVLSGRRKANKVAGAERGDENAD